MEFFTKGVIFKTTFFRNKSEGFKSRKFKNFFGFRKKNIQISRHIQNSIQKFLSVPRIRISWDPSSTDLKSNSILFYLTIEKEILYFFLRFKYFFV